MIITILDYYMEPEVPVMLVQVVVEENEEYESEKRVVRVKLPRLLLFWINFLLGRAIEKQIE